MLTGILGGSAIALALGVVILGWRVIAMGRDYAKRLGDVHERADKAVGEARRDAMTAGVAQRAAEQDRDKFRTSSDTALLSLEAVRIELLREKRVQTELRKRIEDLQTALDHADTPHAVRARLSQLLSGGGQ